MLKQKIEFRALFCAQRFRISFLAVLLLAYALPIGAMDLNQASRAELQSLPGIGPKTAETIIEERERGGAFTSLQDLSARVRGIGPKRLEALKEAGLQAQDPETSQDLATQ
ncbi:MAG TPA: ComEA family DNA-binding protein [Paenalcaligenes sp.]|nr:ComEA family DNA-binding protein [Paenalcaligenes sp.]